MTGGNLTLLHEELDQIIQSQWDPETYMVYYDEAYCLYNNVSYEHRVDLPGSFNYCSVPLTGQDAFLFAGLALLVASLCMGKLSAVWMLVAGGIFGIANYEANLGRISNSISLWLGIQPPDIFFFAFLPPLLTDAAMRLDWYIFKKIWLHIVLMAYIMVIINASILTPFILYGMDFSSRGWDWVHGAVLAAIFAPTDAVSVTAMLKAGGGPETMVVLMEGEALLNDASAVTLYVVFMGILEANSGPGAVMPTVTSLIPTMLRDIVKLTAIGFGLGLAFAIATGWVLKVLRWRGATAYVEAICTLTIAYLCFYVTQGPAKGSGVIGVVVFGIYGSATSRWGMLSHHEASGVQEVVWDTLAFIANGLVFFWAGISSVNFMARSASSLGANAWSYAAIPLIYLFMFSTRALSLIGFNPVFNLLGTVLSWGEIAFSTVAALRGSLSLILIADYTIKNDFYTGTPIDEVNYDIALWTATFVLLTLLVNAPLIGPVMKWTGLSKVTAERVRLRRRAAEEVQQFTEEAIAGLRRSDDDSEFLQGANWEAVAQYVDPSHMLHGFVPGLKRPAGEAGASNASRATHTPPSQPPEGGSSTVGKGGSSDDRDVQAAADAAACQAERGSLDSGKDKGSMERGRGRHRPPLPKRLSRQALDASEDVDGPLLEVPFLQRGGSQWGGWPLRKASSTTDLKAGLDADPAGQHNTSQGGPSGTQLPGSSGGKGAEKGGGKGGSSAVHSSLPRHSLMHRIGAAVRSPTAPSPPPEVAGSGSPPAAGTPAAAAPPPFRRRPLRRPFVSAPDVLALAHLLPAPQPAGAEGAEADEGSDVVMLYSKDDADGGSDFEARYLEAIPSGRPLRPPFLNEQEAPAAVASSTYPAGAPPQLGSERDLLGRPSSKPQGPSSSLPTQRYASSAPAPLLQALKTRRREITGAAQAAAPEEERPGSVIGEGDSSSPADLRARVLTGLHRYFKSKRLRGLLSLQSMRILHYTLEKAGEELGRHPEAPLKLWELLEKEIRPTLLTRCLAPLLAWLLRSFKGAPKPLKAVIRWPVAQLTGLLRKHLGRAMLYACEVVVELYLGLSSSPQLQWVYAGEEAPLWLLEEVEGQLERAYEFVVEREAEVPQQYQAIQSYRAAMALLQQQREFVGRLYQGGTLDEQEQEQLVHALDKKIRHLEIIGPVWRPPHPQSVLRGLQFMAGVPDWLFSIIVEGSSLKQFKPGEVIWRSSSPAGAHALPAGLGVVVSGVISRQWTPGPHEGSPPGPAAVQEERSEGIGGLVGLLPGLGVGAGAEAETALPWEEEVVAQGNGLGRGPLLYSLPQSLLGKVGRLAQQGDPDAAALQAELLRLAAAQVVQCLEHDVTAAVHGFLAGRGLLGWGSISGREVEYQRVAKYSTQVLLDMLGGLPRASVLRLQPHERYSLAQHSVLLQGELAPTVQRGSLRGRLGGGLAAGEAAVQAPAVLPRLAGQQRLFSFYREPVAAAGPAQTEEVFVAGEEGALLVACS